MPELVWEEFDGMWMARGKRANYMVREGMFPLFRRRSSVLYIYKPDGTEDKIYYPGQSRYMAMDEAQQIDEKGFSEEESPRVRL